jgi:tetratricopeptide (TPR) repeat protein
MSSRRTVILMGILLVLLAGHFYGWAIPWRSAVHAVQAVPLPALPGKNSISGLTVKQAPSGAWTVDFDYYYTGSPPLGALNVVLTPEAGSAPNPNGARAYDNFVRMPQRGSHHVSTVLAYPGMQVTTGRIAVVMRAHTFSPTVVASQQIDQVIDWPDFGTFVRDGMIAQNSPEFSLKRAATLIDTGQDAELNEAKSILEKLLERNPQFDPAYVQLARVTLKTNDGREGLHQAEELLGSALGIRPDSADAKILLGQVYAYQGRFAKAEALFSEVAQTPTNNLWLWSNWGEMLEMEHRPDQAMLEYRKAISHPITHDTYDRARQFAYERLIALLDKRKDYDGMESLYKQRIAEFGAGSCYSADYTRFLLQVRGDAQGAINLARRALNQNCDDTPSRELLGLAEYAKWAASTGLQRAEALNQARIFLPTGAKALYLLATSERTMPAARQLIASGETIDQKDNAKFDALAYALQMRDLDAAKRLVALGARTGTPVSELDVPVALLPVLTHDLAGVKTMRQLGVDYSKLRYRGLTAFDVAKQRGDEALLSALGNKDAEL